MTAKITTNERIPANGNKRLICVTELMELFVSHTPGVKLIHDGSTGDVPSSLYVRKYQLPQQIIGEKEVSGPVITFNYNHRDGWASININKRDTEDKASFGAVLGDIWNTKVV